VLVLFGLIVVVTGWFIAVIVDGIASLRPRRLPSRPVLQISFVAVLAAGWLIAPIGSGIHPLVIVGSIVIVSFFALLAAEVLSSSDDRGSSGPSFMFETSANNGWLIRQFALTCRARWPLR
jgi:hypothetical protein